MALKVLMEYGIIWYISRYPVQSCIVGALFTCVGCFLDQFIWSRGQTKKSPCIFAASNQWYGPGIWFVINVMTGFDTQINYGLLMCTQLLISCFWANGCDCMNKYNLIAWIVRNNNIYRSIFVIYTYIDTYLIILSQWPLKMYGIDIGSAPPPPPPGISSSRLSQINIISFSNYQMVTSSHISSSRLSQINIISFSDWSTATQKIYSLPAGTRRLNNVYTTSTFNV